jgi:uncharacterized protein YaaR (DUF327 family)
MVVDTETSSEKRTKNGDWIASQARNDKNKVFLWIFKQVQKNERKGEINSLLDYIQ